MRKTDLGTPNPPPIYVSDVTTISPLIQLLEQIAQQYELKALSNSQIKIQPKTSESYRTITQALTKFHAYRLKKERNYRVVLKNMHYPFNLEEIKAEIENLAHMVSNIWNIQQNKTKLPLFMFFVELKPVPNNTDIYEVEYLQQ
jgi:hypothetical protein